MLGYFVEKEMSSEQWRAKGDVYDSQKNDVRACECYRKAIDLDPLNAKAWNALGRVVGEYDQSQNEAKTCFERAVEITPDYVMAWRNLMMVEKNLGHDARAMEIFNMMKTDLGWGPDTDRMYHLVEEMILG